MFEFISKYSLERQRPVQHFKILLILKDQNASHYKLSLSHSSPALGFQKVNLPNNCLFRFLVFWSYNQNFYASLMLQRRLKLALLKGLQQKRKFQNPFLPKLSLQMTFLGFQRLKLPNRRLFRFLEFLSYSTKFLCVSSALVTEMNAR